MNHPGPPPQRLSVVTVGARDVQRLRTFYTGLGWTVAVEAPDGFTAFMAGGVVFSFWPIESLTAEAAPGVDADGGWSGITLACNVDARDEVDRTFDAWLGAGATAVTAPFDTDWGGRTSYVADPEGNRWEIAWNPEMGFDERGAVVRFGD